MEIDVEELLTKILGDIDVHCETNHDNDVYKNLDNYDKIIYYLLNEVYTTSRWKGDYRGSANSCGSKAYKILEDFRDVLNEMLSNEGLEN